MTTSAAIELDDVRVVRDGRTVLASSTLSIARGSIHVVIGPNGGGKSTLLGAIVGEIEFSGSIRLRFADGGGARTGRLAYVPQTFVADRTLPITVEELYALERQRWPVCLGVRPATRARVATILDTIGLPGFARRRIGELSGGELRRVLIGNAIEPVPELLLCDEPATGLDPGAVERLDDLLRDLRDTHGTTIVIVSHDRAQVRRIADQVSLVAGGVTRTGSADALLGAAGDVVP